MLFTQPFYNTYIGIHILVHVHLSDNSRYLTFWFGHRRITKEFKDLNYIFRPPNKFDFKYLTVPNGTYLHKFALSVSKRKTDFTVV